MTKYDNFYLWANTVVNISPITMKYIREKYIKNSYDYLDNGLKDSDKILNSKKNYIKNYSYILDMIEKDEKISQNIRNRIKENRYNKTQIENILFEMKKRHIGFITIDDEKYPYRLANIYDPPYILFYYGEISLLNSNRPVIAVVGARNSTDYGKNVTKYFVKGLSSKGFIIVSGLARGIDSYSHKYCIDCNSNTIAVMGTAIDNIYPKSNTRLFKEILDSNGLIISEYNYDTKTYPQNFAIRNRIISGISDGVLVTEGKLKSGALITVDSALQQGKNVYSVPGSIFSSMSEGCNYIISEGAKPVQKIEDISADFDKKSEYYEEENHTDINKFSKNSRNNTSSCVNINFDNGFDIDISNEEALIYNTLSVRGVMDIEEISRITKFEIKEVNYIIGKLLLSDLIIEQGFNRYAPNK